MRLTLTGNPNCGKTTLYNTLTGELESVGNWSGVTVAPAEVEMKTDYGIATIIDLPGVYSLSAFSSEEAISLEYIDPEKSDVIVNIVDITNLSRGLYYTTQLLEQGIPMVIALNKVDLLQQELNTRKLALLLGCPVIPISAQRGDSLREMVNLAATASRPAKRAPMTTEKERYAFIQETLDQVYETKQQAYQPQKTDKLDELITTPCLGLPLFFGILWLIFFLAQTVAQGVAILAETLFALWNPLSIFDSTPPLVHSLVVDGMLGGLGAVLGFVPLIMTLFFLLAFLEDCGYMARVAVLMNQYFRHIGLTGKAIIPMVVGTGCSVPGVMATRTIENESQRKRTAILTPFIPCGRKLPVIILLSSLFYQEAPWIYPAIYGVTFLVIFGAGWLLHLLLGTEEEAPVFILELPDYRCPTLSFAWKHMVDKGWDFIKRATTIVLLCNIVLWFLQHWDKSFTPVTNPEESLLATIGTAFVPFFLPLGFGLWELVIATFTGFIAKENVVSTLYVVHFITEQSSLPPDFTLLSGLSYLLFQLFTLPCISAIWAMKKELGNWFPFALGFQLSIGYGLSLFTYQCGTLLLTGSLPSGFALGIALLGLLCLTVALRRKREVDP